ncbi:MAG: hypothetical protein ACYC9M_04020 [Desulfobulbaceae bacterium]
MHSRTFFPWVFIAGMTLQMAVCFQAPAIAADRGGAPAEGDAGYQRPPTADPAEGKPLTDFTSADFSGSHVCFNCHHLLVDGQGNDVSILSHWRSTMMANAAKDPFWQAKVQSEVRRNPALKKVIEQKCATCHMPMAWTQAQATGGYADAAVLGDGFLNRENGLHEAAMDGVSCTLCHQIEDKGLGTQETFSGKFKIDTATEAPHRVVYGPYPDPVKRPMETSVGFAPAYGAQMNHSGLCAACHTLFTPYVDGAGNVVGEFPEQTIFLEWRHSGYNVPDAARYDIGENPGPGKICQECHMPHTPPGKVSIAKWAPPEVTAKDHFSQHFFVGGNVFMLDILQDNVDVLGLTASSDLLEKTKVRTLVQLQRQSARLALGGLRLQGNNLTAGVTVENLTGHKFPSGFPSRRLWIHFTVRDAGGDVVFESGRPLADGTIAGNDNDATASGYEPHHQVITDQGQVQIYETLMKDTDGNVTYTLLRASTYSKDNRLLPMGFAKNTAVPAIAVHGGALADDDFQGGGDTVIYSVNTQGRPGPFTVRADLLYASLSHAFMEDLRKDRDLDLVAKFVSKVEQSDKMPIRVATATAVGK